MAGLRVVLAGVHGHGWWHLRNLRRLEAEQRTRLVGVCDLTPASAELLHGFSAPFQSASLAEVLERTRPDVVIIATPIHTHAELASIAARAGVHLLLEKPPAPTLAAYQQIVDGVAAAGIACQVGFQSLGSEVVLEAGRLIRSGELGAVHGISAAGCWQRDSAYYDRADWAGRRTLNGKDVVDGVLTNPLAHALATALRVDGSESDDLAGPVELELWHGYDIDSDDTACLRLVTGRGTTVTVAATLCAARPGLPYLVIHGERGRAVLWYTRDVLDRQPAGARGLPVLDESRIPPNRALESREHDGQAFEGRMDLLENLADHLASAGSGTARVPLLVPLSATRAFMQVVEAVRLAPAPRPIPASFVQVTPVELAGGRNAERRTVPGVEELITASADRLALFSELGEPWRAGVLNDRSGDHARLHASRTTVEAPPAVTG
jgi:predicted dehydrogenase